jgi:pyrrolidone-carboxylate peptidase
MKLVEITAFDRFGKFEENPSAVLLKSLPVREKTVLPVSYKRVQEWIEAEARNPEQPRALLMLGVSESASTFRVELCARNYGGTRADEEGVSWGGSPIDPSAPPLLRSTLFSPPPALSKEGADGLHSSQEIPSRGSPEAPVGIRGTKGFLGLQGDLFPFVQPSEDAGDYLCNFAYFLALWHLPQVSCGFIHVPTFDRVPREEQQAWLEQILEVILKIV